MNAALRLLATACVAALLAFVSGCGDEPSGPVEIPMRAERLSVDDVREIFSLYSDRLQEVQKQTIAAVTETRFGTERMSSPEPLCDQLQSCGEWFRPATRRWSDDPDQNGQSPFETEHGFDAEGRLRTIRTRPDDSYSLATYVYADGVTDVVRRFPAAESYELERYVYVDDLVRWRYYTDGTGVTEWEYHYDNGLLSDCTLRRWLFETDWQEEKHDAWHTYTFDDEKRLVRIDRLDAEHPVYVFDPDASREDVLQQLEDGLVDVIQQRVSTFVASDTVCSVALAYRNTPEAWPVIELAVGTEPSRDKWALEYPGREPKFWSSMSLDVVEVRPLLSPELTATILTSLRWIDEADEPLRASELLMSVARRLNDMDFSPSISITPEFVIYPLNYDDDSELVSTIESCAPPERVELLRTRGFLPPQPE